VRLRAGVDQEERTASAERLILIVWLKPISVS
jgi:hypothetical protein